MSKGLKALNELKQSCETHMGTMVYILQEDKFKTIEQELKDYEQLKEMYNHALKVHSKLSESIVINVPATVIAEDKICGMLCDII